MPKFTAQNQQSLVAILLRYWEEISAIESEFTLFVGGGDSRPRIDFFHDAIRAHTTLHHTPETEARLSVERLSYDARCLRYLAATPMASLTHEGKALSPGTAITVSGPGLVPRTRPMDRETKHRLAELYAQYGVLFSALLREVADVDYAERTDQLNEEVENLNRVIHALESSAPMGEITALIHQLNEEPLKQNLLMLLPQIKGKSAGALKNLIDRLRAEIKKNDSKIKGVDKAHLEYTTTQLAIYESSKDMLKAMAGKGMNLVGQFVESSLRGASQGRGR